MHVAKKAGHNKVDVELRFLGKAIQPAPGSARRPFPQDPAPKGVAGKAVFRHAVPLRFALGQHKRRAGAFAVHACFGEIPLPLQRYDEHTVAAHLDAGLRRIDETARIAGDLVSQRTQQPAEQAVQLEAEAAAALFHDFFKQCSVFQRGDRAAQEVQVFIGHMQQMCGLQAAQLEIGRASWRESA